MQEHILIDMAKRYPQLLLPLDWGTKDSFLYRQAVLRGMPLAGRPDFSLSGEDRLLAYNTPAGRAEVLYLAQRKDFEHAVQALAYRCQPRSIPKSMGAVAVQGLINWEKIRSHKAVYKASGGTDWNEELKRFTADKSNYIDRLIIVGSGNYSALPSNRAGCAPEQWRRLSLRIRIYHELTHFVCRALYPDDMDAIRDEVLADMIGLIAALGTYDAELAALFLGVERENYRAGGRLENYLTDGLPLEDAAQRARHLIAELKELERPEEKEPVLDFLTRVFPLIKVIS